MDADQAVETTGSEIAAEQEDHGYRAHVTLLFADICDYSELRPQVPIPKKSTTQRERL